MYGSQLVEPYRIGVFEGLSHLPLDPGRVLVGAGPERPLRELVPFPQYISLESQRPQDLLASSVDSICVSRLGAFVFRINAQQRMIL